MGANVTVSIARAETVRVRIADIGGTQMAQMILDDATVWFDDADEGPRIVGQLAQALRAIKGGPIGKEGDDGQLYAAKQMREHIVARTESAATDAQRQAYDAEFGEPAVRAALDARADWDRVAAAGEF